MTDSMRDYLTPGDDIGEFKFSRQVNKRFLIFVEGEGDLEFYISRINREVAEVNDLLGRDRVIELIKEYNKGQDRNFIGIVDKDFWGIYSMPEKIDNLIYSEKYLNLEHMLIDSEALEKFLIKRTSKYRPSEIETNDIKSRVYREANKIFKYRLLNDMRQTLNLNFRRLDLTRYFNEDLCELLEDQLLEDLVRGKNVSKHTVQREANELMRRYDINEKIQGHDASTILGLFFAKFLSNRTIAQKHVERDLISSYDWISFFETDLYEKLSNWQKENGFYFLRHIKSSEIQ